MRWLVPGFRSPFLITSLKRLFAEQRGPSLVLDLVWCSQKYLNPWCNRKRCRVDPHSEDVVCRSGQWSVFVLQGSISYLRALTSSTEALLFHTEDELTGRRCGGHVSYEDRHAVHSSWGNSPSQLNSCLISQYISLYIKFAGLCMCIPHCSHATTSSLHLGRCDLDYIYQYVANQHSNLVHRNYFGLYNVIRYTRPRTKSEDVCIRWPRIQIV